MKNVNYFLLSILLPVLIISCNNASEEEDDSMQEDTMEQSESTATMAWKTDTTFTGSESTLYDADNDVIYVSCGNTQSDVKDGDGFIAILNPDGSVENMDFTTDLNAPKGMAILDGNLFVSDIDEIVQIDLATGEVKNKFPVEGAKFLNDVATDGSVIYFSDMRDNKVYKLMNEGNYELVAENVPKINGLETYNSTLYGLNGEGLIKFDNDGGYEILTDEVQGGDGLVILDDDTFIASRWAGQIFYIDGDQVTKVVDTSPEKSNTADITYIPDEMLIIVPTFLKNEVAAYKLDMGSGN